MQVHDAHIASISRAIDVIEGNLREEITLADVAEAARYSLFHFCRMFNSVTHQTPYDYLMRRRLSESAHDLVGTGRKVIEIAFDYQFNSPETYTRAFKRMFAMLPSHWRKRGTLPPRALMPRLTDRHLHHLHQGAYLKPTITPHEPLRLSGLMTHVRSFDDGAIRRLWHDVLARLTPSASRLPYYGVSWFPDDWDEGGWYYLAAVKEEQLKALPAGFVTKHLPAASYVGFQHSGRWTDRRLTTDYVYHAWLPKSSHVLAGPVEIEVYDGGPPLYDKAAHEWGLWLPLEAKSCEAEERLSP